jgi:hypothetical protein
MSRSHRSLPLAFRQERYFKIAAAVRLQIDAP